MSSVQREVEVFAAPLSFAQRRLWFLNQLEPNSAAYNISAVVRIEGQLDVSALEQSLNEVIRRHETLRTSFVMTGDRVLQVISPELFLKFEHFDLSEAPEKDQQTQQLIREAAQRPFDLQHLPLITARLLRLDAKAHVLVLVMDHIISDGWSLGLLINEITVLYRAFSAGESSPLPELEIQYVDYAEWQREWLSGEKLNSELDYWRRKLAGQVPLLELPADRPAPPVPAEGGATEIITLPLQLATQLKDLSRQQGTTLFMTLLAAFQALLWRYTEQTDFAVGTPVAGRTQPETENLIGCFVNTLVLRADVSGNPTFLELLKRVRQTTLEAHAHQDVPFELLVEELQPERSMTHSPFFQVMMVLHPPLPAIELPGLKIKQIEVEPETAKFDLIFSFREEEHGLTGILEYRTQRFDRSTIKRMGVHFQQLLEGVVAEPAQRISSLPLLIDSERRQLLEDWNQTSTAYPRERCVQHLFEEQVERDPQAVAVVFGDEQVSYGELNQRANQLAHYLQELSVGPEVVVGLCVERSIEMLVGVLGILKAGGAYLPLDPQNPLERSQFMLEDAGVPVLLTQQHLLASIPSHWSQIVSLDDDWELISQHSDSNPQVAMSSENLAYVMYTSGSTGTPKGVSVVHRNVVRLVKETDYARFAADEVFLQTAPLSFDASTFELWGSLLNGAKLVVMPPQQLSFAELGEALTRHEVPTLWLTTGLFNVAVDEGLELSRVRQTLFGGEAVSVKHVKQVLARLGEEQVLIHCYGPTEGTTFSTCHVMDQHTEIDSTVPIGRPIANTEAYVLDRMQQPVPVGIAGELYLGGEGLARGYLNRPDLTAEKFVPHPFSTEGGARLYRTGDRVRYLLGGELEFLGRFDQQVKLRGFRIELGEIEAMLREHSGVQEAVVVAQAEGVEKRLVAYVVLQPEQPLAVSDLRAYLQRRLPEYMVPAGIMAIDEIPLTANGKVDRRALPALTRESGEAEFVAPRTPIEEMLSTLWSEVLGVQRVGATDDFFELGGHSLLATQLLSRVRDTFQVDVPLRHIFEQPRLAEFATVLQAALSGVATAPVPAIVPVSRDHVLPLSFAQQRLWFIDRLIAGTAVYNIPIAVKLSGELDMEAFEQTLSEVIRRHEILRTTFTLDGDIPVQVVHPYEPLRLVTIEAAETQLHEIVEAETQRPFDLSNGPLLRALLVRVSEQEHVALITMHHIITDGWSMGVLVSEVKALYESFVENRPSPLPELAIQYADFAAWEQSLGTSRFEKDLSYWREQLADAPVLELPVDRPRSSLAAHRGSTEQFRLSESLTAALNELSRREGATLFMTLLAAWHVLLARYSGQEDICVGTPIANRNRMDTESLIGFFVNTLVMRLDLSGNPRFSDLLAQARTVCLNGYAHQDMPFEKLVEEITLERNLRHSPLFQVMFVLQNAPLQALELPGLQLSVLDVPVHSAKFDLLLTFQESENGLAGTLDYDTDLFDRSTMERMAQHLQALLEGIATDPHARLLELPLLIDSERRQLLEDWNQTSTAYPRERCVQHLFEEQVERDPQAVAVVFGDKQVSYGELNRHANQLAHYLQELGVGPEVIVGLCVERSVEMLVGVLGILKAGGAYLPLDPQNPLERSQFMLEDARVPVLLMQQHLRSSLPLHCSRVVSLEQIPEHSDSNPAVSVSPQNLAYVMYTSGSTGTPKGVSVTHRNVVRLVKETDYARFAADEVYLQMAPLSFDASTFELWGSLLNGAKLVVMPPQQPSFAELGEALTRHEVTTLWLTTGLFHLAVDEGVELSGVRQLLAGGDALSVKHVKEVLARLGEEQQLINCYGPTENTTFSTCHAMDQHTEIDSTVPIGRPIANTEAYVLDRMQQPVPVGIAGELYLGGEGLARGYLNRPDLTAEKFVPHPFSTERGARLYRTGDRVRYLANGELEFLGRFDQQVKLRGFRIELGEIEAMLREHSGVQEAVVVAQAEGVEKRLVAYVVLQPEQPLAVSDLRAYLQRRLPEYMVPAGIMAIDEIPLTANGKVDRRALPALTRESGEAEFVAPRTPIEEMLSTLWAEVLGVQRVGATDDFFELGGHSLLATQLLSRVRDTFQVDVPLRHIFEQPRLAEFATVLQAALSGVATAPVPAIVPVSRDHVLPLSFAQQRLWFIDRLIAGTAVYNIPIAVKLSGELDMEAFEQTLSEVIRRHEILRTTFTLDGDIPVQVVHPYEPLRLVTIEAAETQLHEIVEAETQRPFDLSNGPLLRALLVRVSEQEHVTLITMHHIITDGWSMGVLVSEVKALYESFIAGKPSPLPELTIQYADFAAWEQSLGTSRFEKDLSYWREQLEAAPVLELPVDRPRSSLAAHRGSTEHFRLSESLTAALNELSRREGATLFMTLLAAWQVLLARYSGQEDICVGTPIANRNRMDTESLIGFFVNTLVMRLDLSGNPRFSDLLAQARTVCLNAYAHQDMPFEKLVEEITLERNLRHSPLFQVMFALQNAPLQALELPGLQLSVLDVPAHAAKFDLLLNFHEAENGFEGRLDYDTDLFDRSTIERMVQHLQTLLEGIVNDPNARLFELSLLSDAERRQLLKDWNDTTTTEPSDCFHTFFEQQAAKMPEQVALVHEELQLTYAELNARANQLAHHLRGLGVGPDTMVAICVERSVEMLVGLLGILKAGGAYVPMDPSHPQQRLSFTLSDTAAPVLLTQANLTTSLPPHEARVLCLDTEWETISGESEENPAVALEPDNLAYVIYTSGSTGLPKGVQVTHRALSNHMLWMRHEIPLTAMDRVLHKTPLTFDASIWELFLPLMCGAQLVLARPGGHQDSAYLVQAVIEKEITVLQAVPTMLRALLAERDIARCRSLRKVFCGGEAVTIDLPERFFSLFADTELYNLYGPTETTIQVTCWRCERESKEAFVPIGRPMPNVQFYVLDALLQPVPIGVTGELYIGGASLARGYLNRPGQTAERFIPDPFSETAGARLYRTGDLVRYHTDGRVEYLGRNDSQVKLRGFRIEIGEIESALAQHESVQGCAVVVREDMAREQRLVAYVVAREGQTIETAELRHYLGERLPVYMIPTLFVRLESLPLLSNGKVDRNALPAPEATTEREYVAPRTPIEEMLAVLWGEVLGVERVGATDNFFELGGHSLLATRMLSRVREAFRVDVPLRYIFEQSRLAEFATVLQAALMGTNVALTPSITPVSRDQVLPLSFAQQRLWFIEQLEPTAAAYHVSEAIRLKGSLKIDVLERTLNEIVRRHEVLRTVFVVNNGEPAQMIIPSLTVELPVVDLSALPENERETAATNECSTHAQLPFDLEHGPLFRIKLIQLGDEDHILMLTMHHIITDAWSSGVVVRELTTLYQAFLTNSPSPLPELPIQYADFAYWQRYWSHDEVNEKELDYWQRQLAGPLPVLALPTDLKRPPQLSYRGASLSFALSPDLTAQLNRLSHTHHSTLFMTLLAAFQTLLHRHTGQEDIIVGTPIANRQRVELEDLIGFFVNTLAIRVDLGGEPTFTELLARVRETALSAYAHQRTPFEKLVQVLQPDRDLSYSPVFQVLFTLQNAPSQTLDLPGLTLTQHQIPSSATRFELECLMFEQEDQLRGILIYSEDLFEEATIRGMLANFEVLLEGIANAPDERINALPLLTAEKEHQLLVEWNDTTAPFPRERCSHELFAEQAERTPHETAVVVGDDRLSFEELNRRANQLAHYLQRLGVGPDSRVGIMMERSAEVLVSILGALKAGGAYLPLDPEYPRDRVLFMLEDAEAHVLLTQRHLLERLPETAARVVCLEDQANAISEESDANPIRDADPENLAFIIYTSGSTGTPKAVAMPHRALVNMVHWQIDRSLKAPRTLQFASLSFDVSFQEIFSTWCSGGALVAVDELTRRDSQRLLRTLIDQRVERLFLPYVALEYLAQASEAENEVPATLRHVIAGGEQLKITPAIRSFFGKLDNAILDNHYGPSETHVTHCFSMSGPSSEWPELPPIGRPMPNTQCYVLDARMQPVPLGVVGELYLGGDCLSRGYLHRPDVTALRYVPNPFATQGGGRLYRTGDLGRYQADGNLQFLGRGDQQVKIRGYRVELGEIEATLRRHPLVREGIVTAHEVKTGGKVLVAYVLPQEGAEIAAADLRQHLSQHVPEYMTPASYIFLSALPLTPSGKINRRALPQPDLTSAANEVFVAPRTPAEELLASLWADVLGVERVGINDNFFDLGGHSLVATRLMSRVREAFRVDLPLRSLFTTPTVAGLAVTIEAERNSGRDVPAMPLVPVSREEELPLSFAQERMWFLNQLDPGSSTYNMSTAIRLRGSLNRTALEQSFTELVRRHEALRTTFREVNGRVVQIIAPVTTAALDFIDLSAMAAAEREDEAQHLLRAESGAPFNLAEGPLLRARLLQLGDQDHVLLLTMHHIVSDGWSMNILVRELTALYSTFVNDIPPALPELPIQYADYAVWQKSWLTGEILDRQLTYWRTQLQQPLPLLELPADRRRPPVQTYNGAQHRLELSAETSARLKELSRQNGVTAFMTLLAAFKVLLLRHTGQKDVIVGTPVAGRNRTEVEGLIGFLVNTLVLRTSLSGDPTFRELLHRVREVTLDAHQHQDLPFEKLVDALQVPRDPSHTPLFQVLFAFQNLLPDQINVQGLEIGGIELPDETAKFDLMLIASERGDQTIGTIVYNTDLFELGTIERLADHFVTLVEALADDPSLRLSQLNLLTDEERGDLMELGRNRREYPRDKSIAELFEQQVELTPEAIALEFEDTRLTYRQLNEKANQLAHYLIKLGVTPDSLVGLCVERSVELIVGVIGILKAGGAYLPLDPSYPRERLSAMLDDTQVKVLLTQEPLVSKLPANAALVVLIDSDADQIARESIENPDINLRSDNLAYVMYTSGSTGRPKGVSVTHRNVVRLVKNTNYATLDARQTFLQFAPISFDASTFEIWGALLNGARLVVMSPQPPTLEELAAVLIQRRVTMLWLTAGLFHQMAGYHLNALGSLRYLLAGGDVLSPEHVTRVLQSSSTLRLVNGYGPTESTTFACCHVMSDPNDVGDTVSIGKPIANTETYVLDQQLQLVPLGAAGELCIGGDGLARGYLNRPDLTAERFVPNPFSTEPGARLYRTGDIVRYRNDGPLEFMGRRDYQVKVRGFRIELGEVEVACAQHPEVKEALVVAHGELAEDKRLVAYLVADTSISKSELRSFLKEKLPDYMVPSAFVVLDEFPLTPNGKIDRRALPLPGDSDQEQREDLSPRTPVEDMLANIWADVLDQKTVGLHDDFFELGGHSLLATQVITRIRGAFQVELPLRELFINPTVAALAQVIDNALKEGQTLTGPPLERVSRDQDLPLSFAQQRLWFIDQLEPNNAAYNLPVAVRLKGALHVPALKKSLTEVVRRHEVLRTVFDADRPIQYVLPPGKLALPIVDLTELDPQTRETETRELCLAEVKRPFKLSEAPLVRAGLVKLADDEYVLQIVMHHIVGDAGSLEILLREVIPLYQAFRADQPSPLEELAVQYADYAYWQREWLQGESLAKLLAYWKPRLEGAPALLELPADHPRPAVQSSRGDRHTFAIGPELTHALKKLSRREGATIFMTLLAAFQTLLSRYTGVEDIVVGADVNNRTRLETEGLIGFFINMLVLRTDLSGNPTFKELLGRVRQTALGAYAHQEMPLEKLVEELQPERNLSYSPLFQVVFNFNNGSPQPPQLPDVQLSPLPFDFTEVKFDLSLFMWDDPESLIGMWTYSTDLFEADRIRRMHEHFVTLLQSIVDQPEQRLNALEYLTEAERDAQAAARRKLKQANFQKFKGLRPQAIKHSRVDLVQAEFLNPGESLPLFIRPDVEDVDLAAWAKDNVQFIDAQLSKHGALLFRGFSVSSLPEFRKVTTAISPELLDYSEPSSPRTHLQDRIYTLTEYPADQWIQLHNEMSYAHTWPRRVFFFCDQPAQQGGETPIAFSRKVFELLDPKIRERFMQRKVMYVRNFGDGLDLPWQHVFHTDDKDAVAAYCRAANVEFEWNNGRLKTRQVRQAVIKHPESNETVWFNQAHAFHASTLDAQIREFLLSEKTENEFPRNAYYGDGSPIESSVIAEIREAYRQAAVTFPWQRGDILMLDNMRVAHGRAPFVGPRKILVAMSGSVSNLEVDTNGDLT